MTVPSALMSGANSRLAPPGHKYCSPVHKRRPTSASRTRPRHNLIQDPALLQPQRRDVGHRTWRPTPDN